MYNVQFIKNTAVECTAVKWTEKETVVRHNCKVFQKSGSSFVFFNADM